MSDRPKYTNRGGEVWERTEDGERELFAADCVARVIDLERKLAEAREVMQAATVLIAAKGRHNTKLAYDGLREALARIGENV